MRKTFLIIGLIVIMACDNKTSTELKNTSINDKKAQLPVEQNDKLTDESEIDYAIIDDQFAHDPFGFEQNAYAELKKLNPKRVKSEPMENEFVDGQIDTLYTFHFDRSSFRIYKMPDRQFVVTAIVGDSIVGFKNKVMIGMSKQAFLKKFDKLVEADSIHDTFRVEISDNEQWVDFKFHNNKLAQAKYQGYID